MQRMMGWIRRETRSAASISIMGAALLAAATLAPAAWANDVSNNILVVGGTTPFSAVHTDNFDFTDVFTFSVDGAISANVSMITIGSGAQNIDFVSADLNGVALILSPAGFLETGSLADTAFTGPLVLTVRGKSGATGGTFASYAGTLNVTIVPEPTTAVLMGLGLAGLGLASRRRARD